MQAMADAVENSEFVILCMSDAYKHSIYCQAEAEYEFHCKRHLIPIIVCQEFTKACTLLLKEMTLQREHQLDNSTTDNHIIYEDQSKLIEFMDKSKLS
ncbi:unnamed protein product [Rotaria sordida]|uniref:TIR domain-containing protein n=1 Tax=Rotaria sordida TaxID=392033 RepID=A0A815GIF0_9BILA|nr:unnamed protein product [Rotaria sordida]CAF1339253.1 unnamed protein product [Rotaria sordida]CAF1424222.1 unnamed protein product [Rotaria sordida]CAF1595179.1 unnamed protein product [Rotaria sordida]CAF3857662.1 unnamed protein product [Rotaria sordida]